MVKKKIIDLIVELYAVVMFTWFSYRNIKLCIHFYKIRILNWNSSKLLISFFNNTKCYWFTSVKPEFLVSNALKIQCRAHFSKILFLILDQNSGSRTPSPSSSISLGNCIGSTATSVGNATTNFLSANNIDPQRMTLDISLLKKQYAKLKERQQQAQVILTGTFINL